MEPDPRLARMLRRMDYDYMPEAITLDNPIWDSDPEDIQGRQYAVSLYVAQRRLQEAESIIRDLTDTSQAACDIDRFNDDFEKAVKWLEGRSDEEASLLFGEPS